MTTPRLSLTEIAVGQTFKEIAHNEALRIIDALMSGKAISRTITTPPGSPTEGDVYIVPATGATGAWTGQGNKIAHFYGAAWFFYSPKTGMTLWVDADNGWSYYNGTAWNISSSSIKALTMTDANYTAQPADLTSNIIRIIGTLTAQRNFIVPAINSQYTIINSTTGGFGVQLISTTGTGIVIANLRAASGVFNGANMLRLTADSVLT